MNTPTLWSEKKIDDSTVQYVSEHTSRGPIVVTATKVSAGGGEKIVWDDENDVPLFLNDRAAAALGLNA
jgi:hypothetical protein